MNHYDKVKVNYPIFMLIGAEYWWDSTRKL